MEQDNGLDNKKLVKEKIDFYVNDREHHHHSHHSHHSHHNSSHSNHKKHHKKRTSGSKKSWFTRIKEAINKKVNNKVNVVLVLSMIFVMLISIITLYTLETRDRDYIGDYQGDTNSNESQQGDQVPEYVPTANVEIPSYWKNMIEEKTEIVKSLQAAGGKDCVSFVWASDTHIPDNHTARTNDLGKLMAKMMDNCDIPFALLTGDIGTRSSLDTEAELVRTQKMIPIHLAPLWGTNRLLTGIGNHDGCYGDASCYYQKQFSPERMWDLYFRNQALDSRRVFSEDGSYYYIDNIAQKIRIIVLNSQYGGEYETDSNGVATNNRFSTSCYGQKQLDWLSSVALDMPEGYGAVITAHVPPNVTYTVDKVQLIGIINAYCNKTTYSGSYTVGVDGWTNNSIEVDFTGAKGEIIAMFTGHVHQDTIDTTTLKCPLITIISAGAQVNDGEIPERTFYTDQETSFDVVTINRKTRTIHLTRVGYGEDRLVRY